MFDIAWSQCMRYIDIGIMFIVIAIYLSTCINNGTGSQVTTLKDTVFITYPMLESRSKYVQKNVFAIEY